MIFTPGWTIGTTMPFLRKKPPSPEEGHINKLLDTYSEFDWVPREKLLEMSLTPYEIKGRTAEAVRKHIVPLATFLLTAELSRQAGWLTRYRGGQNYYRMTNLFWRIGEAVGDIITSGSREELGWRILASNIDILSYSHDPMNARYHARRTLAYLPLLYQALPEVLWELGVISPGQAEIKIQSESLQGRMSLTMARPSEKEEEVNIPFAYIDLTILPGAHSKQELQSNYEQALLKLDESARKAGVSRIRFYGAQESGKNGAELSLYLNVSFQDETSKLVKFPAHFGLVKDGQWWTQALDSRTLLGMYNKRDQYKVVQAWNALRGYGLPLLNPLSEVILTHIPEIIAQAAGSKLKQTATAQWQQKTWEFFVPSLEFTTDDVQLLAVSSLPRQSNLHTVIDNGGGGTLFIDDSKSRRSAWPQMMLLTQTAFDDVSEASLVNLDRHLPWLAARGSARISGQLITNYVYGKVAQNILFWRMPKYRLRRAAPALRVVMFDEITVMGGSR